MLIVEDELLIAVLLEEDLHSAGFAVIGPFKDLDTAAQGSQQEQIDAAILDINLSGEMSYPLADELLARNIPFMFLTGYGAAHLPERFRRVPRVAKPYDPEILIGELGRILKANSDRPD